MLLATALVPLLLLFTGSGASEQAKLELGECSLSNAQSSGDLRLSDECHLSTSEMVLHNDHGAACAVRMTDSGAITSNCTVEAPAVASNELRVGPSRYNIWSADACPSHGDPAIHMRSTPDSRCNADGVATTGQSQNSARSSYSSFDASIGAYRANCMYAYGYLHILTSQVCNTGSYEGMYHFLLEGAEERGAYSCRVGGRIFPNALHPGGGCVPSNYDLTTYCTAGKKLALRFEKSADTNTRNYHLIDFTLSSLCAHRPLAHGCITQTASFNVTTAMFSPLMVETFDLSGAVDLRSTPKSAN